ncbi:hydrolase [Halothiobacillus diazotrophicus]|uniref:Hydrolase n=1 Tax=Halothiobacillus diazotrophicus TaxID=1860122 RepID=A0A191ZGY7_9GAMM|nr:HAD hydrolase-like protein [Halothiobacillus diazotrophicus]ANJ67149.1 hydrolase [Halothiobacillus diazotrophicus]
MNIRPLITHLFLDIGGVLLTNGWDHEARQRAADHFGLDLADLEARHHLTFDTYEAGKISLDTYLERVVFHQKRTFTLGEFQAFMVAQSQPDNAMIGLMSRLKTRYGLKIAVVSNEGRELNAYRINTFHLNEFVDTFISSCFVHRRKPDEDIFRLALDITQAKAENVLYIENTPLFVQVAESLGIQGLLHTDFHATRSRLVAYGLADTSDARE